MDSTQPEGHSLGGGSRPGTANELRDKRLAKLEQRASASIAEESSNPMEEDDDLQAALALSLHHENEAVEVVADLVSQPHAATTPNPSPTPPNVDSLDITEFHSIMWDNRVTTDNDKDRWVGQGIDVRQEDSPAAALEALPETLETRLSLIGSNHLPWGLTQTHGGPCGVLAAIQAELLRIIIFGCHQGTLTCPSTIGDTEVSPNMSDLDPSLIRQGLSMAIAVIVARAALMPSVSDDKSEQEHEAKIVLPANYKQDYTGLIWKDLEPWVSTVSVRSEYFLVYTIQPAVTVKRQRTSGTTSPTLPLSREERITILAESIASFLQEQMVLDCFQKPGGVVLLVMALVASRGVSTILNDMDDNTSKLTSQFGHSSQELINLLLTGQAVSNVFDNTMTPSGSICRGIQQRSAVGYLSQLESMRYLEVGGFYKNPRFPIWVVGSTSHFTVLFGDASCLKESKSDELLEKCRRAFKKVDGEENGFISRLDLAKVYEILEFDIGGEHSVQTLAATLEVNGADIILWDDFWKATSRLMSGASLETVLQGDDDSPPQFLRVSNQPETEAATALLRITEHGEPRPSAAAAAAAPKPETDEEMARRLASEWGAPPPSSVAAPAPTPEPMTDEDYARQLQAEWDAETFGTGGGSVSAVMGDDETQNAVADDVTTETLDDDEKMADMEPSDLATNTTPDFERFGNTFPLYHYNGLRGGTLTHFRVTRLTAEEAVGASIAIGANSGGGIMGGDLEDVVRTKWPSCMLNWLGKTPPYID